MKSMLLDGAKIYQRLTSCIVIYLDSFFGVAMWVGCFNLLYVFPGLYWFSLLGVLILSMSVLMKMKAFHCSTGVPLAIYTDEVEHVFTPNTYFGCNLHNSSIYKIILDTIFN